MLTPKLPEDQKALVALPQSVEVILAEDASNPIAFVMPPFEDIAEIEGLKDLNFSLHEFNHKAEVGARSSFKIEFDQLYRKHDRYADSPVYLNRLANLAALAGDKEAAEKYISEAFSLSGDKFYAHRFGANLLTPDSIEAAESFFSGLDLSSDLVANLRLASFCVQRRDFARAEMLVDKALSIDPLDFGARLFDGGMHLMSQRYQKAVHSLRLAINERPTSSSAHCNIALAYMGMQENEKALSSLKRSVALDPLNANAVLLLADWSFALKRDEEAVPSLRYFVRCEQKNAGAWSRLARACFRLGIFDESISALKHQGSVNDSSDVWNNLGVTYQKLGWKKRAVESFTHAMRVEERGLTKNYFLAARNLAQVMANEGLYKQLQKFTETMLGQDAKGIVAADRQLSDIVAFNVHAIAKQEQPKNAVRVIKDYLALSDISDVLAVWLVSALVSYQSLHGNNDDIDMIVGEFQVKANALGLTDMETKERYFNNVAFAFAEMGRIEDAEHCLKNVIHSIHKSAYPTATFGLIQIKKGRIDRGVALYEEAIKLASSREDTARIKQKLNLELGKYWRSLNGVKARRFLEKVIGQKGGEDMLVREAQKISGGLPHK